MPLKDYYSILGVSPGAHVEDIKKAYRKLALIHHPDKNKDNPYAAAYFHEIREAYETLTDPIKKDQYLQQRWYTQAIGKKFSERASSPETVLNDAIQLNKYVHSLNQFRVDSAGLSTHINNVLNDDTVELLLRFNAIEINKQIVILLTECLDVLEKHHADAIVMKLKKLSAGDFKMIAAIERKVTRNRSNERFERYKIWLILLVTLVICLVIWLS